MNFEKIGYSLIGSLIAGSVLQKNIGLDQQYFFIISAGLWGICIGVQWWNYKREQRIREKFENSSLESRDTIVNRILETISEKSESEITCIREEAKKIYEGQMGINNELKESLNKICDLLMTANDSLDEFCNTEVPKLEELILGCKEISSDLHASVCKLDIKLTEVSQINKKIMENVPGTIVAGEKNIISSIEKETKERNQLIEDKLASTASLIDSSIIELGTSVGTIINFIEAASVENKDCVCDVISTLKEVIDGNRDRTIEQITRLNKGLINSIEMMNNTIEIDQEAVLTKLTELFKDLPGILSSVQSSLDEANGEIREIHGIDNNMYELLEDVKSEFPDVKSAIEEGTQNISEAVSHSMDKQISIVTEEQNILESYNELLSRINDEVIAKMINDSNTLLKCLKDCYNLLDSQRRAKK